MNNYYALFGLEPSCSLEDIKKSFRKKAKQFHPDLTAGRGVNDGEKLRTLLTAYKVLSDPDRRSEYDRIHRLHRNTDNFDYRVFLKSRSHDSESQSKLIFYDLLHDHEEEALELYESLLLNSEFSLELFLEREDFMDCAFLLAEEYEKRQQFEKAFYLLTRIVRCERKKPYFRHFFDEVVTRLRVLVNVKLPTVLTKQELLSYYFKLVDFNFSSKETAYYIKKIAELYLALDRKDLAAEYLQRGLRINKKLPGYKKLEEKIMST